VQWLKSLGLILWVLGSARSPSSAMVTVCYGWWTPRRPGLCFMRSCPISWLSFSTSLSLCSPNKRVCHCNVHGAIASCCFSTSHPYRYANAQKTKLEWQCDDMLRRGIIRHSSSAFSTPVLLIKKADNSWHFYVGYRMLNTCTIKDKFPIPVIEEMFDELCHTRFFTKLDICSGYHQVFMHPNNV
jgi:hypothetical protein